VLGRTVISHNEMAADPDPDGEMLPDVSQRITEFRRVKVKDGRKVWELTAKEAQYFEDRGEVMVERPEAAFYAGDGQQIRITGKQGRIATKGNDLEQIHLDGGIEVSVGPYRLETDNALYLQDTDSVYAPGRVKLSSDAISLEGDVMVLDLNTQRVKVMKGVTTTFRRAPAAEKEKSGSDAAPVGKEAHADNP
jgi:LPS export ABC transporter protein LptC